MGENETKKQNVIEAASSASSPAVIKTAASQIIEIEDDAPQEPPRRFRPIPKWKNLSYTTRVTMAFALIAGMTVLVAVGVLSFVWEQHFQSYTRENVQITAEVAATVVERDRGARGTGYIGVARIPWHGGNRRARQGCVRLNG